MTDIPVVPAELDCLRVQVGNVGSSDFYTLYIPTRLNAELFFDFYEKNEADCLPLLYEKGDRVLDSGAGIGYITRLISKFADFVLGVEAMGNSLAYAKLNTGGCKNVTLLEGALGLSSGLVEFHMRQLSYASSLIDNEHGAHDPILQSVMVEGLDANDLIRAYDINCLHLDLEGSEIELLEGLDLSRIQKVTWESHQYIYGKPGTARIVAALLRNGFIPLLENVPYISVDGADTFIMAWARPDIVARKFEQFGGFTHRTIHFLDMGIDMIPRTT